ncbi:LacI family DNA-binding transcriptional regulator [Alicyclobacillus ferrooxydans]|uniref:LacI family DNA-binding transcriptional regulator n=1 Tax=Alicyclobacillus ferrooxydans TaxID=471514 RepID=UPI0006D53CCB|nr:LacI family DNA-binding transcriptional regulator [Alicyclobacillus ferrooxydans]
MANQSVTIKDVAKAAGVSITTVSRFLNRRYDSMSVETKQRIEQVIAKLHYQPNKMAQGLKGQSRTVAVVVVNLGYPYAVAVIRSISSVLNAAGYSLLVCESSGDREQEAQLLQSLMAQGVDGIIIQTSGDNNELLERIALEKPVVLMDRQFDIPSAINVITDNQAASQKLTERLFEEGYRSVIYVSEPTEGLSTRELRLKGYETACDLSGASPDVRWVLREDPASVDALVRELAEHPPERPFTVYTANGLVMLDLYPRLVQLPYMVPTEMGLATFDEPDWVHVTSPRLTCVRQPTDEIGIAAAEAVLDRLGISEAVLDRLGITVDSTADATRTLASEVIWNRSTTRRS